MLTITSGIAKTKDKIQDRLKHNLRLEKSHRNIKNKKANYFITENGKIEISTISKKERQAKLEKLKEEYQEALEENFLLLQKQKREGNISRMERKSRLRPITEGVVNFGGVYDIQKDTLEEIQEKTKKFNEAIDANLDEVLNLVYKNLQEFAEEYNTDITNLVLHRDEQGIYHFHYLIKMYDKTTGEKLNFKHNKKNIGRRLQDKIAEGFEKFHIHRTTPDKKTRKKTKEQLIEYQEAQEENIKLKRENEELKKSISEYTDIIEKIKSNIETLLTIQDEKKVKALKDKLAYILETGNGDMTAKLEKLFSKTTRQITAINKKNSR